MKPRLKNHWNRGMFAGVLFVFSLLFSAASGYAQDSGKTIPVASFSQANCSGFISEAGVSQLGQILGAEEGKKKNDLATGDLLYFGGEGLAGAQTGQEFFVVRLHRKVEKFGTLFTDIAHVQVVNLHENVLVGRITFSCEPLNVGDWVIPPQTRALPVGPTAVPLDIFAGPSGKGEGEIIASKEELVQLGQGLVVFLNVGENQGLSAGSRLRIFRTGKEAAVNEHNRNNYRKYAKTMNFPRQILGECVVLQAGKNTSTAIITESLEELYLGDRVELE